MQKLKKSIPNEPGAGHGAIGDVDAGVGKPY